MARSVGGADRENDSAGRKSKKHQEVQRRPRVLFDSRMPPDRDLLTLLHDVRGRLGDAGSLSLEALAARAGWSRFHLHRAFRRIVGETPKQYALRLRLARAAAALITTDDPVLTIAVAAGFASHEVFTRAFRRRYGCTPARYRAVALQDVSLPDPAEHPDPADWRTEIYWPLAKS
jgi:AraC-like DNA-binding protein